MDAIGGQPMVNCGDTTKHMSENMDAGKRHGRDPTKSVHSSKYAVTMVKDKPAAINNAAQNRAHTLSESPTRSTVSRWD